MGAVNTTYTFTATDTITSSKMNNIIDQTTITTDAIIGTTLDVASGKLKIRSQGITSNEMGVNAVTANALASNAVTTAKILNANVTTAKILDANVTTAKILDANVTTAKIEDAAITAPKLNGEQTGTAPIYGVRAWGSVESTGATKRSQNISSITKPSTGNYTVDFSVDMPSSTYAIVASTETSLGNITLYAEFYEKGSAGFKIRTSYRDGSGDRSQADADFDFMVLA